MARKKKVTIRIGDSGEEDRVSVKVTFNRRTVTFLTESLDKDDLANDERVKDYLNTLEKIIRYEYSVVGEDYKMNGLTHRMYDYEKLLKPTISYELEKAIIVPLGDVLTYTQYRKVEDSVFKVDSQLVDRLYFSVPYKLRYLQDEYAKNLHSYYDDTLISRIKAYNFFLHLELDYWLSQKPVKLDLSEAITSKFGAFKFIDWQYGNKMIERAKLLFAQQEFQKFNEIESMKFMDENFRWNDIEFQDFVHLVETPINKALILNMYGLR
jgi:hypothetical protein